MLESMEPPLTQLPSLRTVALESPDADGYAGLAERLPALRAAGKVRTRTCNEAQQLGKEGKQDSGDEGAVSPLWYPGAERFSWERERW